MVFYCQRNCYAKELKTRVKTCRSAKTDVIIDGEKKLRDCYEVTFEDTVLFPEGGGQPYDTGTVDNTNVLKVVRQGGEAVHYLDQPVDVGAEVLQTVDWKRRHDHMQQHTGQHLITAVADHLYGFKTLSWYLGPKISSIELDTSTVTKEQMEEIESDVNQRIRVATPVVITEYDADDAHLREVRTRGLPDDVKGQIRVVTITDLDDNMCCGTHVRNLSDLQSIKLTHVEKGKANHSLLYFLTGKRILDYLGTCLEREKELSKLLNSNPAEHTKLVEKIKKDLKVSNRGLQDSLKALAVKVAEGFLRLDPRPSYFIHRRALADNDYLSCIIKGIGDDSVLKVLACGEDSGPGILIVDGQKDVAQIVGKRLCELLGGKGGGKTRFTARINKLSKWDEVEAIVKDVLSLNVEL